MNGGFNPPPAPENSTFILADPSPEEQREELELRNSKEWKESERHILRLESKKTDFALRAKEIAKSKGLNPLRCEAVEDAARHVAETVEDIPELQQLNYLSNRMRNLNDPTSDTWKEINEEVKKWRSWDDFDVP